MSNLKASTLLFAVAVGGVGFSAPLLTAPPAQAQCNASQQWDPVTGTCWTKQDRNSMGTAQGANGCRPGELGNCLGALQNATNPGGTLNIQPPAGSAPRLPITP